MSKRAGASRREGRWLATTLVTVFLGAFGFESSADALPRLGEDEWLLVESENFSLISNATQRKTREVALGLERFRRVLERLRPGSTFTSPVPTKIYVFKNDRSFKPYKRRREAGLAAVGLFVANQYGNYIALNANPTQGDALSIIAHEYVHFYVRHNYPGIPLSLNEGLAEYYSTFSVLAGEAQIGVPVARHLRYVQRNSLSPVASLLRVDTGSPEYNETQRQGALYAESWLLVHYLFSSGEVEAADAVRLLERFDEGMTVEDAIASALDLSVPELEKRIRRYVNGRKFRLSTVPIDDVELSREVEVRSMGDAETLYHLGDLMRQGGDERLAAATEHFNAALELDDRYPEPWVGLGMLAKSQDQRERAIELFGRGIDAGSEVAHAYVARADLLLEQLDRSGLRDRAGSTLWKQARTDLERALQLDPSFAEAWALLGTVAFYDPRALAEGIGHLERALEFLPGRAELVYNLAVLRVRAGELNAASALVERRLASSDRSDLYRSAAEAIERARILEEANRAVAEGEPRRAADVYRRALDFASETEVRRQVERQLALLEDQAVRFEQTAQYNRAVDLTNRGELEEALSLLEELEPLVNDVSLKLEIRSLVRDLRSALGLG